MILLILAGNKGEGMIRGRGGVWGSLLAAQALSRLALLGGCRDLKPRVRRAVMFQDTQKGGYWIFYQRENASRSQRFNICLRFHFLWK